MFRHQHNILRDNKTPVVSIVLQCTGVVMGEFGFGERYERKIKEIKHGPDDENEIVQSFTADYVTELQHRAKSDHCQAEENIELRKHSKGVREEEADEDGGEE